MDGSTCLNYRVAKLLKNPKNINTFLNIIFSAVLKCTVLFSKGRNYYKLILLLENFDDAIFQNFIKNT